MRRPTLPQDEHNQRLDANVQPPGYRNPVPSGRYNMVVIGAGTAGLITALAAAGLGAKVALIERERTGGDCLNVGCVPSKGVIRASRAVADAREASQYGVRGAEGSAADFGAAMARMRRLRARISAVDSVARLTAAGVEVYLGEGRFVAPDAVEVDGRRLEFARACVATGGRPAVPAIPGLGEVGYRTNETIFELTALPPRLAVIGGGPIGCELAQAFRRLGSEVTLLTDGDRLLPRDDPDASARIRRQFGKEGIRLVFGAKVQRATREMGETRKTGATLETARTAESGRAGEPGRTAEPGRTGERSRAGEPGRTAEPDRASGAGGRSGSDEISGNGAKRLDFAAGAAVGHVIADEILVAAGRAPNVEGLGLEAAGIEYDRRGVRTDDFLRTTNPRVYAAGDVTRGYKFTHAADAMARIVVQNALFFGRRRASALVVPWCTYTDPEVAHVGLTATEAEARRIPTATFTISFEEVDRAVLDGEEEGFARAVVRRGSDRLLGVTIVARHAGEMIGEASLAMTHRLGLSALSATIHPYPTQAEALRKLGDAYRRSRLTPPVRRLLETLLRWRR